MLRPHGWLHIVFSATFFIKTSKNAYHYIPYLSVNQLVIRMISGLNDFCLQSRVENTSFIQMNWAFQSAQFFFIIKWTQLKLHLLSSKETSAISSFIMQKYALIFRLMADNKMQNISFSVLLCYFFFGNFQIKRKVAIKIHGEIYKDR